MWEDHGITSFTIASGNQTMDTTYYFLREALKTQSPKIVLIETLFANDPQKNEEGDYTTDLSRLYWTDLSMRWSLDYASLVLDQAKNYNLEPNFRNELLFRMPIIHSRYSELKKADFVDQSDYYIGYIGSYETRGNGDDAVLTDEVKNLNEFAVKYIEKILSLCEEKNVIPVFFCAPYPETETGSAIQNGVATFLAQKNVDFIDFNKFYKEIGIDFDTDLRSDNDHLNNSGAEKVTHYLQEYMLDLVPLEDRRSDEKNTVWDQETRLLFDREQQNVLESCESTDESLNTASTIYIKLQYDVIILTRGTHLLNDTVVRDGLKQWGIDDETYETGGTWLLHEGEIVYYSNGAEGYPYTTMLGTNEFALDQDGVWFNEQKYPGATDGIDIIIYDSKLDLIVDSIYIDTATNGSEFIRTKDMVDY